jgi:23S rRNA (uracil1939-C5)-methyltransferase
VSELETIVRVAGRGDGVTETGRYVPLTAPGDRVAPDGRVTGGPHRAEPPCRHFPECGGCQLQHLDDASYARFLSDRIVSALASHGIGAPPIQEVHISPPCSRRRAGLSAERRGREIRLGFKSERSHRIVDMRECHILRSELFGLVQPLRDLLLKLDLQRRGAMVRMTLADQGAEVILEHAVSDGLETAEALTGFAQQHRLARLAVDDGFGPEVRWEPEPVTVTLSGVAVPLPTDSFLQATAEGEAALVDGVHQAVGDADRVADLFAGLGTFALAMDRCGLAVEAARDAALALETATRRAGRPLEVEHRDLYRRPLATEELNRFGAIVLDPPRAGAKEQVRELARSRVPRIAYVSCNPTTFARDARLLCDGGYRIVWARPIGQFRWSTHVELVSLILRD